MAAASADSHAVSPAGLGADLAAARRAARALAGLGAGGRSTLLRAFASALQQPGVRTQVLAANAQDLARTRDEAARGTLEPALLKRLGLDEKKLDALVAGLVQLADMPDLVGKRLEHRELDTGLVLERVSCPLGVMGAVFEARPDALVQIISLAWKSGNAIVLKGGREARESNRALTEVAQQVLSAHDIDPRSTLLLEDRAAVDALLARHDLVDLMVARGSSAFVHHVRSNTKIPVMAHADGICHAYLHAAADPALAAPLLVDSKCSYPAACNAVETLLWDPGAGAALDACVSALLANGVELRVCAATRARYPQFPQLQPATDADWDTEYGALVLAIKQVQDLGEALAHIETHGSRHTETIVTSDGTAAARFLDEVDAACVFHNASTRFSDGFRFGLGAEVGISTDKLHARGPVGVAGLLTYRWLLHGNGQVTSSYGPGGRAFSHRDLP
ncbi:MAG TPA: glutamate-5-semialdehyde dehydrogenase [Polyangia bacterium]